MEITTTYYAPDRKSWRDWLKENYQQEKEIWLIYYRKETGNPRIAYNDAVEEALCFGWIDSTVKKLDGERNVQRFSPRKHGSGYSQINKERLRRMIAQGKVMEDVLTNLGDLLEEQFVIPEDILLAFQANERAWQNFQRFSGAYQRIRIGYVQAARDRPQEFTKRLANLIRMTEKNKQFGYGIEEYY